MLRFSKTTKLSYLSVITAQLALISLISLYRDTNFESFKWGRHFSVLTVLMSLLISSFLFVDVAFSTELGIF